MITFFSRTIKSIRDSGETLNLLDGVFVWLLQTETTISCEMDFDIYPFDTQICSVWIANADINVGKELMVYEGEVSTAKITQKSLSYEVNYHNVSNAKLTRVYPLFRKKWMTGFHIQLSRKLTPYVMKIYLPTLTIVLISMISFFIPVQSIPGTLVRKGNI